MTVLSTIIRKYRTHTPQGAGILHLLQITTKLSTSILASSIILYITRSLHVPDLTASGLTGAFFAMSYFFHLVGGYIGGRFLSYRNLLVVGNILEIGSCLLLSVPTFTNLLWGLAIFSCAYGLNVSCNCLLTQLFQPGDKKREFAFLWNYAGVNFSYFIGFLIAGYFDLSNSYQTLFLICVLTNLLSFSITTINWHSLNDIGTRFVKLTTAKKMQSRMIAAGIILIAVLSTRFLMGNIQLCNIAIWVVSILLYLYLILLTLKQRTPESRNKLFAFLFFVLVLIMAWTLQYIVPMGLNLFTERNVNRHIAGILFAPQWIVNINNLVPIVAGPLLGFLFIRLRESGFVISITMQFSLALLLTGIAYILLPIGINLANAQGYSSPVWALWSYSLLSIGDLLVTPIGFALVGLLAPKKNRNLLMGATMMFSSISSLLADYFSKLMLAKTTSTAPLLTNGNYSQAFNFLGWSALITSVLLAFVIPYLIRLTKEDKEISEPVVSESLAI